MLGHLGLECSKSDERGGHSKGNVIKNVFLAVKITKRTEFCLNVS